MNQERLKGQPRPTLAQANQWLADRGWKPSAGCWEDERMVFALSQESYPGTYGGAAASVAWTAEEGWLVLPESKPARVRFV